MTSGNNIDEKGISAESIATGYSLSMAMHSYGSTGDCVQFESLIDEYVRAWNAKDVERVLKLLDKRATYYDALWMEYVPSRELPGYIRSCFDEEDLRYARVGDVVSIAGNVAYYRYAAYRRNDDGSDSLSFHGAEVFSFRQDRMVAISDFYCDPEPDTLAEIARLSAQYHGETRRVEAGLGGLKALRFRRRLMRFLEKDRVYLAPELTQLQLATLIDCSGSQLAQLIDDEFGTDFRNCIEQYRVKHAKMLLRQSVDDEPDFAGVARCSGFRSLDHFRNAFRRIARESPEEFRGHQLRRSNADR